MSTESNPTAKPMSNIRLCFLVDPEKDDRHISDVVADSDCYWGDWNQFEWWQLGMPEAPEPECLSYETEELETQQGGFIINYPWTEAPMEWFLSVSRKYPVLNCWMDLDNAEAKSWHRWEAVGGVITSYTHSEPLQAV